MELFINDNIKQQRFYIEEGLLEPVHLGLNERDILIEGIKFTMNTCQKEIEV